MVHEPSTVKAAGPWQLNKLLLSQLARPWIFFLCFPVWLNDVVIAVGLEISSSVTSGAFNVPQIVSLKTSDSASIYYTLNGALPDKTNRILYREPFGIQRDSTVTAVATDGVEQSLPLKLVIRILSVPTSKAERSLKTINRSPIRQNITRIAFYHGDTRGERIVCSTLESYHRNLNGDRFLLYEYNLSANRNASIVGEGSIEARSYAYSKSLGKYVLGMSLGPQVTVYDPVIHRMDTVFNRRDAGAWIHGIATQGDFAYTILSTPASPVSGMNGLLKVSLSTGNWEVIPFNRVMDQNWGGVQSVDPSGRVWFYRAYPFTQMWYDQKSGMRNRKLTGHEDWSVESWDLWGDDFYLILTNKKNEFLKKRVNISDLSPAEDRIENTDKNKVFEGLLPLDLFHQGSPSVQQLYYDPKAMVFYSLIWDRKSITALGSADLGKFELSGYIDSPMEVPSRWVHPELGQLEALGLRENGCLLLWLRGQKTYCEVELQTGALTLNNLDLENLSGADVSSMAMGRNGRVYGGGILTLCDLFQFDPATHQTTILRQAVPHLEGQVNSLLSGFDGNLYGAAYPDSVLFKYDPGRRWNPGRASSNNPQNLGPMGHHNQMRPTLGLQDGDSNIWFQSVSDYSEPVVHAFGKANFNEQTTLIKSDIDDQFPIIRSMAIFDKDHLLLCGREGQSYFLYLLAQKSFAIKAKRPLESEGLLLNIDTPMGSEQRPFFISDRFVFRVRDDLTLQMLHKSIKPVAKAINGSGGDLILIGKTHVEIVNNEKARWEIWWNREDKPGSYLFRHLAYVPALFHLGNLYIADEEKLNILSPYPVLLDGVHNLRDKSFGFTVRYSPTATVEIDTSADLLKWVFFTNFSGSGTSYVFDRDLLRFENKF